MYVHTFQTYAVYNLGNLLKNHDSHFLLGAPTGNPRREATERQAICPWYFNPPIHTDSPVARILRRPGGDTKIQGWL